MLMKFLEMYSNKSPRWPLGKVLITIIIFNITQGHFTRLTILHLMPIRICIPGGDSGETGSAAVPQLQWLGFNTDLWRPCKFSLWSVSSTTNLSHIPKTCRLFVSLLLYVIPNSGANSRIGIMGRKERWFVGNKWRKGIDLGAHSGLIISCCGASSGASPSCNGRLQSN